MSENKLEKLKDLEKQAAKRDEARREAERKARAARRKLKAAEAEALASAHQELGAAVAKAVGANDAEAVLKLHDALDAEVIRELFGIDSSDTEQPAQQAHLSGESADGDSGEASWDQDAEGRADAGYGVEGESGWSQ